jgi:hypothetical protein
MVMVRVMVKVRVRVGVRVIGLGLGLLKQHASSHFFSNNTVPCHATTVDKMSHGSLG